MAIGSDDPLTVTLVSTERLWQGGEEQAWQLALGLRRRGHRCTIVALRAAPFAQRLQHAGFDVRTVGGKLPLPHRVWALRRSLRTWRSQIVHCNDAQAVLLGGLAAKCLPDCATVAARRVSFPIRSPAKYRYLCDRVLCVSTAVAAVCAQAGLPRERLGVVHDGVDPARIAAGDRARGRCALGLRGDELLVLSVGSLVTCKGHQDLVDAFPAVRQRLPQARCAIAGAGDQESALRAQIEQRGLVDVVRLLRYRDDVPDLLHACDLFVFPSRDEGLGSTLIDAMLARRPIVTTTAGGIPDLSGSPVPARADYAWVVPPASPAELGRAVIEALEHPHWCAEMIERAAERAASEFTHDAMVDATVRQYRAMLEASCVGHASSAR
ncbi:MAG: glycosyltransferase [Pirellulaceae bacterium]|jgi:glycosyltransferase involved in cell wall biosynthesis|nr:glycosyltransferase [Pirellulaceae bacterium]